MQNDAATAVRLRAKVRRVTGNTRHRGAGAELPAPAWVEIEPADGHLYLLYFDVNGEGITDTWHETWRTRRRKRTSSSRSPRATGRTCKGDDVGVDAYLVRFTLDESVATTEARLGTLGFVRESKRSGEGELFLRLDDGAHLFEGHLTAIAAGGAHLSLRFAICHSSSVDEPFLRLWTRIVDYWQQAFGSESAKLSCPEAIRKFIMR